MTVAPVIVGWMGWGGVFELDVGLEGTLGAIGLGAVADLALVASNNLAGGSPRALFSYSGLCLFCVLEGRKDTRRVVAVVAGWG